MSGFVYCLMEVQHRAFKIGSSYDSTQRAKTIGEEFDFSSSFQVKTRDRREAYSIERVLHFMFRNYRHPDIAVAADGRTEWFDIAAFDKVRLFLLEQKDSLGCGAPHVVSAPIERPVSRPSGRCHAPGAIDCEQGNLSTHQIDDQLHYMRLEEKMKNGTLLLPNIDAIGGKSLNQLARIGESLSLNNVTLLLSDCSYPPELAGQTALLVLTALAECDRRWKRERNRPSDGKPRGKKGGRPSLPAEKIAAIQALAASGRGPAEVCKALGIGRSTFYKHIGPLAGSLN